MPQQPTATMKSVTEFLPPKERVLRSEQIGLSSHKNAYNNGTLMNNWIEERNAYDYLEKINTNPSFVALQQTGPTLNQTLYQHPTELKPNAYQVAEPILPNETGKEILFVHGDDKFEKSLVTMSALTFSHQKDALKTEDALKSIKTIKPQITGQQAPVRLLEQKKAQWQVEREDERDPTSSFKTTYQTEIEKKEKLSEISTTCTHIPSNMHLTTKSILPDKPMMAPSGDINSSSWGDELGKTKEALQFAPPQAKPTNKWGDFTKSMREDYRKTGLRKPVEYKVTPLATLAKHQ
ncbi:hypothetical protein C9374_005300 [Naegleria lovaniensis]|uniref:Uncharacterized protein n=1 Tax=Naegleria lovaniensis TaxID=51637 RepID=A0AA88GM16_NAELO|nr:uncharacterized protein C9374_005300 [Naegleria lovaniensis]KAG2382720.1 hypothetical protein C9374_005300 [Naegleria lovaniensis]